MVYAVSGLLKISKPGRRWPSDSNAGFLNLGRSREGRQEGVSQWLALVVLFYVPRGMPVATWGPERKDISATYIYFFRKVGIQRT